MKSHSGVMYLWMTILVCTIVKKQHYYLLECACEERVFALLMLLVCSCALQQKQPAIPELSERALSGPSYSKRTPNPAVQRQLYGS